MQRSIRAAAVVSMFTIVGCQVDEAEPEQSDDMFAALERDLGLPRDVLERRLTAEAIAAQIAPTMRDQLGAAFGGAWMNSDGTALVVGITDAARADEVRRAGAEPVVVRRNLQELQSAIDRAPTADASIHAWRVDVANNRVVVTADDPGSPAVAAFITRLGLEPSAIAVERSTERPHPLYDLRGGDEYIINSNTLCSVGFAVNGGFVTAGHCGRAGSPTAGSNWVAQGTFRGSTFPGNDWAWVELNGSWASLPFVGNHNNGQVDVAGSQVAPVGSSICRSGRTTGWRCGVIQATNVTVNYAAGPVYGTTQTNACAEGGDSGGSFISGNQAQGVTSGGSGNCSSGGTTFFQPLNPILATYGLTLKTAGGHGAKSFASNFNGKCIDVPGGNFVDGAKLQMWDCNGTGAQKWTFAGGTLQAGGKCMDVAGANTANGTAVQLANCNGNAAQQFVLSPAGDLVSVLANKCIDIAGWDSNNGARLIIWPCTGNANQKWHLQ